MSSLDGIYEQFISGICDLEKKRSNGWTESKKALELAKDRAKPFPKTLPFPKNRIVFWEKKSPRGRLKSGALIH